MSSTATTTSNYKGLAIFAWVTLAWSWRGSDTPFIVGLLLVLFWVWITHTKNNATEQYNPKLPSGVGVSIALWCGVLLLGTLWRTFEGIPFSLMTLATSLKWISLLVFVPCGWLLYKHQSQLLWLLLTPALAVVLRIIGHTSFDTWETDLFGRGFNGFGLHHVPFGMQASLAIISLLALGPALVRSLSKFRWLAIILLVAAGLLLTQALLRCGSRSGVICLCIGVAVLLWQNRRFLLQRAMSTQGAITSVLLLGLAAGAVFANYDQLHKRFYLGAYQAANYSFNLDEIPRDKDIFFGRRLHLSVFGIEKLEERPVFGYGPGGAKVLLRADIDFHIHPNLHNMYVQTPVELGITGALAWLAVSISLLIGALKYGKKMKQPYLLNYFWSTAIALAIWSIQSAPIYDAAWRFTVILICSLASLICYLGRKNSVHTPAPQN